MGPQAIGEMCVVLQKLLSAQQSLGLEDRRAGVHTPDLTVAVWPRQARAGGQRQARPPSSSRQRVGVVRGRALSQKLFGAVSSPVTCLMCDSGRIDSSGPEVLCSVRDPPPSLVRQRSWKLRLEFRPSVWGGRGSSPSRQDARPRKHICCRGPW